MNHEKYIKLCFDLAKKAQGYTSPNPLVGAVVVYKNKIIGKGYHTVFGNPHAEVEAINDAIKNGYKDLLPKSVLYVNLEPCCHWGKTPPCVDKIINSGVKKVVCSMYDPNPKVKTKGIKKLKNAGVKCVVGILEKEAKQLNKFYIKWITKRLPYITIKSAMTFDGKIATVKGKSKWISSDKSRKYVYHLRSVYDAVLVGINTVLVDNPELTTHGYGRNPVRVIVGDVRKIMKDIKKYNVLNNKAKTVIFSPGNQNKTFNIPGLKNVFVHMYKTQKIFFRQIFSTLAKEYNITSVLVEGGGETVWNIIKEKLVDDFIIFISPKIFGGKNAKTWVEGEGVKLPSNAYKVKFLTVEQIDKDFVIKAKFIY